MNLDPEANNLNEVEFTALLLPLTYDEIQALYATLDYWHKVLLVRHCALLCKEYVERRNQLTTITEIKEYVRMLPIWQERQSALSLQVDRLKASREQNVPDVQSPLG